MHPTVFRLACLALFAGVLALMAQESAADSKAFDCCKKTSRQRVKAPILGFRTQEKSPPCVQAVIFNTTEGEKCVDSRMRWVRVKIQEYMAKKTV